jgi:hypothetical protein
MHPGEERVVFTVFVVLLLRNEWKCETEDTQQDARGSFHEHSPLVFGM